MQERMSTCMWATSKGGKHEKDKCGYIGMCEERKGTRHQQYQHNKQ